jgi:hypothetical protein
MRDAVSFVLSDHQRDEFLAQLRPEVPPPNPRLETHHQLAVCVERERERESECGAALLQLVVHPKARPGRAPLNAALTRINISCALRGRWVTPYLSSEIAT